MWSLPNHIWQRTEGSNGASHNDRIPDWAHDQYNACVFWKDDLVYTALGRQGRSSGMGHCWGWILVDRRLDYHILGIGFIDASGEEHEIVNAWEEPGNG